MVWLICILVVVVLVVMLRRVDVDKFDVGMESKKRKTRRSASAFDNDLMEAREKASSLSEQAQETVKPAAEELKPEPPSVAQDGLYGMKNISSGEYLKPDNKLKRPF